jgi:hypothetical protein
VREKISLKVCILYFKVNLLMSFLRYYHD